MVLNQVYATYEWKGNRGVDGYEYCPLYGTKFTQKEIAKKTRPFFPGCGFTFFRNPLPIVSVLVIHKNRVLLGKGPAEPGAGKWVLPRGYIEFEDDFLSAAIREVKEETGLEVEVLSILNVQSGVLPPDHHFLGVHLLATVSGGILQVEDDLGSVNWFPISGPLPDMAFQLEIEPIQAYSSGNSYGMPINRTPNKDESIG